ncbi:hypothetical protein Tco_0121355 [Tanacetum coccineum]
MLERGSYIPWASRFKRYLNRKKKYNGIGSGLLNALDVGPYEFKNFRSESLDNTTGLQTATRSLKWKRSFLLELSKSRVRDSKYFMEQMLLAKQDEAGVILIDEQNDFLFADASRMEEIEELSANISLNGRNQPADHSYGCGASLEKLARNAYQEAEKQRIFAQQVQTQNTHLTSQLEIYKEQVRILEIINKDNNYLNEFLEADERAKHYNKQAQSQLVRDRGLSFDDFRKKQRDKLDLDVKNYKRKNEELQKTHSILKRQMSEKEDTYHDTILDLEAKLKKNVDLILKLGNSLQGMFMLGPKYIVVS